jgi:hypothetical protein
MSEPIYRKCDAKDCDLPATHWLVWTKPQVYCRIHAQGMVNVGNAMGYPTPASTVRPLWLDEMIVGEEGKSGTDEVD